MDEEFYDLYFDDETGGDIPENGELTLEWDQSAEIVADLEEPFAQFETAERSEYLLGSGSGQESITTEELEELGFMKDHEAANTSRIERGQMLAHDGSSITEDLRSGGSELLDVHLSLLSDLNAAGESVQHWSTELPDGSVQENYTFYTTDAPGNVSWENYSRIVVKESSAAEVLVDVDADDDSLPEARGTLLFGLRNSPPDPHPPQSTPAGRAGSDSPRLKNQYSPSFLMENNTDSTLETTLGSRFRGNDKENGGNDKEESGNNDKEGERQNREALSIDIDKLQFRHSGETTASPELERNWEPLDSSQAGMTGFEKDTQVPIVTMRPFAKLEVTGQNPTSQPSDRKVEVVLPSLSVYRDSTDVHRGNDRAKNVGDKKEDRRENLEVFGIDIDEDDQSIVIDKRASGKTSSLSRASTVNAGLNPFIASKVSVYAESKREVMPTADCVLPLPSVILGPDLGIQKSTEIVDSRLRGNDNGCGNEILEALKVSDREIMALSEAEAEMTGAEADTVALSGGERPEVMETDGVVMRESISESHSIEPMASLTACRQGRESSWILVSARPRQDDEMILDCAPPEAGTRVDRDDEIQSTVVAEGPDFGGQLEDEETETQFRHSGLTRIQRNWDLSDPEQARMTSFEMSSSDYVQDVREEHQQVNESEAGEAIINEISPHFQHDTPMRVHSTSRIDREGVRRVQLVAQTERTTVSPERPGYQQSDGEPRAQERIPVEPTVVDRRERITTVSVEPEKIINISLDESQESDEYPAEIVTQQEPNKRQTFLERASSPSLVRSSAADQDEEHWEVPAIHLVEEKYEYARA